MHLLQKALTVAIAGSIAAGTTHPCRAQASPQPPAGSAPAASQSPASTPDPAPPTPLPAANAQALAQPSNVPAPASQQAPTSEKKSYIVPAGTKVLLQLRSAINTKSARQGDGVYLASTFPVVVGNRVMIPEGVYVQGTIDHIVRAGRVSGKSQLDMHFTSIIFPNGTVVEIPGIVNSLPGASKQTVKEDGEGTIEQNPDKGRNAGEVAKIAIPTGGTVGSIGGLASGHPIAGGVAGIGAGLAAAGLVSLFTRGADVNIPNGTQVEMVLQRPLVVEEENLTGAAASLTPATNQPKPLEKPIPAHLVCPPGGLGCQ
ncbi:MAG: hypothetical protein ABSF53_09785 [Terracidiphilus sp.]